MTKQIKTRWTSVLKSGARGLEVVRDAIAHTQQHGDTSLLAHMITSAEKADMKSYASRVRLIVGAVYPEARIKKSKDGGVSITRGDTFAETEFLAVEHFVSEGVSLIGAKVNDRFGTPKEEASVDEQLNKRVKSDAKFILDTDGISLDVYVSELRKTYAAAAAAKLAKAAA